MVGLVHEQGQVRLFYIGESKSEVAIPHFLMKVKKMNEKDFRNDCCIFVHNRYNGKFLYSCRLI